MLMLAALFATVQVLAPAPPQPTPPIDLGAAYSACQSAATKQQAETADVIAKCEPPALAGLPGAQYALGVHLAGSGSPEGVAKGVDWLEKAVSSGHPAARYQLAMILARRTDAVSQTRARALLRGAACAGLPAALEVLAKNGQSRDVLQCEPDPYTEFAGEWILHLKRDGSATSAATHRLVIRGTTARAYWKSGEQWVEAKPGKFTIELRGRSARVSVFDSGWDFDGKWTESWTIQLMRTSMDEADVAFFRAVNNEDLPEAFDWRTFASLSEGRAYRVER